MKDYFEKHDKQHEEQLAKVEASKEQGPDFVFGAFQNLTMAEILDSLPPRPTVNRLLSLYFNSKYLTVRTSIALLFPAHP